MLKTDHLNGDNPSQIYFDKINMLLDRSLKIINKRKLKFKSKIWITNICNYL